MKSPKYISLVLAVLLSSVAFGQKKDSIENKKRFAYRCVQSISNDADKSPMYILNGFQTTENIVNQLDPNSIESVTIIKGVEAQVIYGTEGRNGAIMIVLKKLKRKEIQKLKKESNIALAQRKVKDTVKIRN